MEHKEKINAWLLISNRPEQLAGERQTTLLYTCIMYVWAIFHHFLNKSSFESPSLSKTVREILWETKNGREEKEEEAKLENLVINYEDLDNFSKTKCVLSDMCILQSFPSGVYKNVWKYDDDTHTCFSS